MDAEKVTEVEMKELNPEIQDDKDPEKGNMEKTKEAKKEADQKEEEEETKNKLKGGHVYCKLKNPTEDIYQTSSPSSSSKSNEESEKKAESKEIKEEVNVYSKLNSPTEDVYNPMMTSSSSKRIKEAEKKAEEKEIKEEEEKGYVYRQLSSPTEDVYNPAMPLSSSKRNKATKGEKQEEEENEEAEDLYCKLEDPSENVYMAAMGSSSKEVYKKLRLYKRISAVFIILFVILLAVVFALSLKLNGTCPESTDAKCTCELCQTRCPLKPVKGCIECEKGWGRFENSCYFKSKKRQNWQNSKQDCQEMGGDLVVIDNERVQQFLTNHSKMMYWIGLHYSEEQQWMWINNTVPTQMFWNPTAQISNSQGSCALVMGDKNSLYNWFSNSCDVISNYICQIVKYKE